MSNLTIMIGDQAGITFELKKRPLSVGRDPSRDIQIMDLKVSRKHAVIRKGESGHAIAPTKAMNGLLINGQEIADEYQLQDGYTNAVHHRKVTDRSSREAITII